ncbi:transglutaminase domain-containing protein [Clostridium sp. WB02_MRS01]|uniref:transglutaminase domain-containing protein n=1 Tax=Clostridium sp. WB02_MRS01 TaxID=2605777 RepID=UPI0012B34F53|nr:transglutaminase domain-containing protein [Clostridium sp. WB02_MRS01]
MKHRILAVALLFTIIIPTLKSYANPFDLSNKSDNRASANKTEYTEEKDISQITLLEDKDNPWIGTGAESYIKDYTGRIHGTWQKRGEDYYYVLPDGTDLKNNYVDNLYLSWTGRMIPEQSPDWNYFLYNIYYGGQSYYTYGLNGYWKAGDHTYLTRFDSYYTNLDKVRHEYTTEPNGIYAYIKETLDWLDMHIPTLIDLPEKERAIAIAELVANSMVYEYGGESSAEALHQHKGMCKDFASIYAEMARRAGLSVKIEIGYASNGGYHAWNSIRIDGNVYWFDVTYYNYTRENKYLLSPTLWAGYNTNQMMEERYQKGLPSPYNYTLPTYENGIGAF